MENAIYNELRTRGFQVDVGMVEKRGRTANGRQKKASLIHVGDSFKKIIVVRDVVKVSRDEHGITMMSIYDFLLNENSLEL